MLEFKKITIEDYPVFKKYLDSDNEYSCETTFVNLLVWQNAYVNMYAVKDNQLIIRTGHTGKDIYRLPFGDDFEKGMNIIREYTGEKYPEFFVQEGRRLDEFIVSYGEHYIMREFRNAFDYIYLRDNLATLSGKKYHSKRNHIASFSKSFDWHYEPINSCNLEKVRECAALWYAENKERMDKYLLTEKQGIENVLSNMDVFGVRGGMIIVDEKAVAFTLGSAINSDVFDVHFEKALREYATAYTVINNEFAKNALSEYKYINREDDMGLDGLRKAKLSYKPEIMLKKYYCTHGE